MTALQHAHTTQIYMPGTCSVNMSDQKKMNKKIEHNLAYIWPCQTDLQLINFWIVAWFVPNKTRFTTLPPTVCVQKVVLIIGSGLNLQWIKKKTRHSWSQKQETIRPSSHRMRKHICVQIFTQILWCCVQAVWTIPLTAVCFKICVRVLRGAPCPVWTRPKEVYLFLDFVQFCITTAMTVTQGCTVSSLRSAQGTQQNATKSIYFAMSSSVDTNSFGNSSRIQFVVGNDTEAKRTQREKIHVPCVRQKSLETYSSAPNVTLPPLSAMSRTFPNPPSCSAPRTKSNVNPVMTMIIWKASFQTVARMPPWKKRDRSSAWKSCVLSGTQGWLYLWHVPRQCRKCTPIRHWQWIILCSNQSLDEHRNNNLKSVPSCDPEYNFALCFYPETRTLAYG